MDYLLSVQNLSKKYNNQFAINNINLNLKKGEIYGLIGKNGAGKTTLLKIIAGLVKPSNGDISLFDYSGDDRMKVLSRIGTLIEAPGLYPNLTAYDNLKLKCLCLGINEPKYIGSILEIVGLEAESNKKVKQYSLGMKQRLGIAMALVGEPDLLLLDEPINGLDPQGIKDVRDIVLKLNKELGITMIISSHILDELLKIVDRFGIINDGRLLKEISKAELKEICCNHIEIKIEEPKKAIVVLDKLGFNNYKVIDNHTINIYERLNDSGLISMELYKNNISINSISIESISIEDYFIYLTGGNIHEQSN